MIASRIRVLAMLGLALWVPLSAMYAADAPKVATAGRTSSSCWPTSGGARPRAMRAIRTSRRRISTGWPGRVNFRNAVSVCPVCSPYRAALMTGRYPTSTGMFLNDALCLTASCAWPRRSQRPATTRRYIGKWHLDGHGRAAFIPPERRQGFEYWKAAECDHNYNTFALLRGDSPRRRFWTATTRSPRPEDAQPYLRRAGRGRSAFRAPGFLRHSAFPAANAPAGVQGPVPAGEDPAAAERAARTCRTRRAGRPGLLRALHGPGQVHRRCAADADETGLARRHDPRVHLRPRRDAGLARVPAGDEASAVGRIGPCTLSAALPRRSRPAGARRANTADHTGHPADVAGTGGRGVPQTVEGEDLSARLRAGRTRRSGRCTWGLRPSPAAGSARSIGPSAPATTRTFAVWRGPGSCSTTNGIRTSWRTSWTGRSPRRVRNELDQRLQAQLKKIGDDFRPGPAHIAEWGYQIAPHGSVPYKGNDLAPQTPQRKPSSS